MPDSIAQASVEESKQFDEEKVKIKKPMAKKKKKKAANNSRPPIDDSLQADNSIFKSRPALVSIGCGSMCIDDSVHVPALKPKNKI